MIIYCNNTTNFIFITERRPLKPQLPTPLFRSPSTRLIQREMLHDDRGSDASNLGSLGGSIKEMHHYTFQPSKQIVSEISFLKFLFFSMENFLLFLLNLKLRFFSVFSLDG